MTNLHPSVETLVRRVIADRKKFDWFAEFDAIAELNRLAHEQEAPPGRDLPAHLDTPLVVGNVSLRRLSWSGVEWFNTSAIPMWREKPQVREIALAWAHSHSRDPAAMSEMVARGETSARRRLTVWAWGLTASWEAIQAAIDVLLPASRSRAPGEPGAQLSRDSVLSLLVTKTGLPDKHWLFEVSYERVCDVLREIRESTWADQARMAALLGKRISEPDDSWAVQAFIRFSDASKAFLDKHGVVHRRQDKRRQRAGGGKATK